MGHLLLDIDGVISPFLHPNPPQEGYSACVTPWATWWVHPIHAEVLRRIKARGHILTWATSWEDDALALTQFWDVPPFDAVIKFSENPSLPYHHPKQTGIERYCAKFRNEHIVWVDDDIPDNDVPSWVTRIPNLSLVRCIPSVGWNPAKIQTTMKLLDR